MNRAWSLRQLASFAVVGRIRVVGLGWLGCPACSSHVDSGDTSAGSGGSWMGGGGGARSIEVGRGDASEGTAHPVTTGGLVHALCDTVQACCTAAQRGFDAVHCRQVVVQQFAVPWSDTTLAFDPVQEERCVRNVTRVAQACGSVDLTTCFDAFIGNVPAGAACASSFECARGPGGYAVCGQDGLCTQPKRGALGDACSFTCIERNDGAPQCRAVFYGVTGVTQAACHSDDSLVCVTGNNTATCQPLSTDCKQNPTGSCSTGQDCDLTSGKCYVPVKVGASCATARCGSDAYCGNGICTALKPNAATCMNDVECQSGKCEQSSCVVYSIAAADWCGARLSP